MGVTSNAFAYRVRIDFRYVHLLGHVGTGGATSGEALTAVDRHGQHDLDSGWRNLRDGYPWWDSSNRDGTPMTKTITIPAPHVPYGPVGVPENEADARYLRDAIKNLKHLSHGERMWGSNLTATIIKLLGDAADALDTEPKEN